MTTTNLCPRCGIDVDDDGDGDCAACASAGNRLVRTLMLLRGYCDQLTVQVHSLTLERNDLLHNHKASIDKYLRCAASLVQNALRDEKLPHADRPKLALEITLLRQKDEEDVKP